MHGFAKKSVFEIEKSTDSEIIFLLKESSDTLKHYPFHFELRIIYTLKNDSIHIKYSVTNTDTKTMYFSIGAHEAYACDGGIENYSLVFDTCESFETLLLNDGFLNHKVQKITDDSCKLPLKYSYMKFDSNLKSKTVKLKNNITGDTVAIDFSDFKICFYGQFQTPNIYVSNHGTVFPIMLTVITI
jgi:galactose mutarotase-like enzyme